ncbi:conserved protein of unknown function [Burkholderia multivorans]
MHATQPAPSADGHRPTVSARADRHAKAAVIHVIEITDMIEAMEMMEAMESVDEDEAHAGSKEKRRPPVPGGGIRVSRERIPQDATVRAFHDLPRSVALQTGTPHDLLRRVVDFRLSQNRPALGVVIRPIAVHLCHRRPGKDDKGETYPEMKQVAHNRLLH